MPNFLSTFRVSQIVLRGGSKSPQLERIKNFAEGIFLSGGGNLRRIEFDHSNLFQSKNNIIHKNIFIYLFIVHNTIVYHAMSKYV